MKLKIPVLLAVLAATTFTLAAEESAAMKTMRSALEYRVQMAAAVGKNTESAKSALERLRANGSASGMPLPAEADFAHASLDIGHRLLAVDRPDAAEVFFRAAEVAFDRVAKRTPSSQPREKARYLEKLSLVRGNYLNKGSQAKADIDEAIRLQPEDKSLEASRDKLARGRGEEFKKTKKN